MGISSSVNVEEEPGKCSTPTPLTRIVPKLFDPRSPTEGINRTPIEVPCTPKQKNKIALLQGMSLQFDTPSSSKTVDNVTNEMVKDVEIGFNNEVQNTDAVTTEVECVNNEKESDLNASTENLISHASSKIDGDNNSENDCVVLHEEITIRKEQKIMQTEIKKMYLETDIDAVDGNLANLHIQHPRIKQLRKSKVVSTDSNTTNDMSVNTTLSSRIDGISFTDFSVDDPSVIVSDMDDVFNNEDSASSDTVARTDIQEWLITIEDDCQSLIPFDIPADNTETGTANLFSDVTNQQRFFTPENKKHQGSNQRTPLSCLVQNRVVEQIKESSNLKKKQWRGIQEERARRGLSLGEENTPPLPPPLDKVSSAPSKLMVRRRHFAEWDQDVTMLI